MLNDHSAMELSESAKQFITESINTSNRRLEESFNDNLSQKINELKLELSSVKAENRTLRRQLKDVDIRYDSLEQYGRRTSVRIEGLEFQEGETNDELLVKVKEKLAKVDVTLLDSDVFRLHRSARAVEKDGKLFKQTLLKLSNWKIRERMQGINRTARVKKVGVRVHNDLTARRFALLSSARGRIYSNLARQYSAEEIGKLSDAENVFAYANINCELRIRARGTVLKFNTEDELERILSETFD